jgi:hypothetical protein
MTETKPQLSNDDLASLAGWDIAVAFGCGYSGDSNPIEHGGFFYDLRDWESYGYAATVEFWSDPEASNDTLIVQTGTIHKPNRETLKNALTSIGLNPNDTHPLEAEIEATKSWVGIEPEGTEFPYLKHFVLKDWREDRIWRSIRGWIEQLGR